MKKLTATLFSLIVSASAFALPIGNPTEASLMRDGVFCDGHCADWCDPCVSWCDAWSFRVGFWGDYVFNRNLQVDKSPHATIHETTLNTNAAYLAFNMYDRVDLFATLGASHLSLATPGSTFGPNSDYDYLETETNFSWSIGLRGTLWECGCLGVGAEAQYFRTNPDVNFVRNEDSAPRYVNEDLSYSEWQVGLGAGYRINIAACATAFIPYLGVKWSGVHADLGFGNDGEFFPDLENDRCFGYAFGLTLLGCNKSAVTVEARFIDEKAVHVNAQFRY